MRTRVVMATDNFHRLCMVKMLFKHYLRYFQLHLFHTYKDQHKSQVENTYTVYFHSLGELESQFIGLGAI